MSPARAPRRPAGDPDVARWIAALEARRAAIGAGEATLLELRDATREGEITTGEMELHGGLSGPAARDLRHRSAGNGPRESRYRGKRAA